MTSIPEYQEVFPTDTKGRVQTSPERREGLLAEFDRSQMTGAAFARWAGIKYPTFMAWLAKRKTTTQAVQPQKTDAPVAWLEAVVDQQRCQQTPRPAQFKESARLELGLGVFMDLATPAHAILAAELIRQLRGGEPC